MNHSSATDVVIGCITDYDFDAIRPWVASLESCGFRGDKVMIVYNAAFALVDQLVERGFLVITFDRDDNRRWYRFADSSGEQILVSRFFHIWCLLSDPLGAGYRYAISVDVKDVVFQTDPSAWLENHLGDKSLNVGSESVRLQDEPWLSGVVTTTFEASVADYMKNKTVFNAGTMAGKALTIRDFALQVFLAAAGRAQHPDQACANILLSLHPFESITRFNTSEDGWACQAGTSVAASYMTGTRVPLLEPSPTLSGDTVVTSRGVPFCLVHQYDRVPEWNRVLREKYAERTDPRRSGGRVVAKPNWRLKPSR